jgi:hypothetical protein
MVINGSEWRAQNASSSGRRAIADLSPVALAQHSDRSAPGQPHQIDHGFGVPAPSQHTAGAGAQWEDMSRPTEVIRPRTRIGQDPDRAGAIRGRDARRRPLARVDADEERRPSRIGVAGDHRVQRELAGPPCGHRRTDDARGVPEEEGDRFTGDVLGRHDQIAFVLPSLVVDDDDHAPAGDGSEGILHQRLDGTVRPRIPHPRLRRPHRPRLAFLALMF